MVGTSMPVDGRHSAVMVGRLLLRVGEFIPMLIEQRPWGSFRWSEVFPGMQRRQFVSEVLRRLTGEHGTDLKSSHITPIMMEVGLKIDTGDAWLECLFEQLASAMHRSPAEARELVLRHASFVDALAYTQLGNPEMIVGYVESAESRDG